MPDGVESEGLASAQRDLELERREREVTAREDALARRLSALEPRETALGQRESELTRLIAASDQEKASLEVTLRDVHARAAEADHSFDSREAVLQREIDRLRSSLSEETGINHAGRQQARVASERHEAQVRQLQLDLQGARNESQRQAGLVLPAERDARLAQSRAKELENVLRIESEAKAKLEQFVARIRETLQRVTNELVAANEELKRLRLGQQERESWPIGGSQSSRPLPPSRVQRRAR